MNYKGVSEIEVELQASEIESTLALALYLLFMGTFPIWLDALSNFYETCRRIYDSPIYLIYRSFHWNCSHSKYSWNIVLCSFQATGASTSLVLGPAIITDLYPAEKRGKTFEYFTLGFALGLTTGKMNFVIFSSFSVLFCY